MSGEETPFTPYMIQRALGVQVDGMWGPSTERAARLFLGDPKDDTGRPWTRKRLVVGVQQKLMADAGIKVTVDGLPGLETYTAFDRWKELQSDPAFDKDQDGKRDAKPEEPKEVDASMGADFFRAILNWWRRPEPKEEPDPVVVQPATEPVNQVTRPPKSRPAIIQPTTWPRQSGVEDFFGEPGHVPLTKVRCPWPLFLAWEPNTRVETIAIHTKVAGSLERVLRAQVEHYGQDGLRALGVHRYGGSYNVRKMRGSNAWSMHAYGIAIDFDPDNNQFKWNHERARLARPDADAWWAIWESEGWVSLGRERDMDWMHVQACRL